MKVDRYPAAEIIRAYKETGSVWEAGKRLGIAGQTVHKKLVALGYPLANRQWSDDEVEELRSLVGNMTLSEIADRLGRPYAGVACKISEVGIGTRYGNRNGWAKKIPRGAGYDKVSLGRYVKQIDSSGDTVHRFARRNGLGVESLCRALERSFPDWWLAYRAAHSDLPEAQCPYCSCSFIPSSGKQVYCSRKCGADARVDKAYFGGRRRQTIGLGEGICQLCGRSGKSLSSHHVYGKENDGDNEFLIALCQGCHQAITHLALRPFLDSPAGWEALIQLCYLRRHGHDQPAGVYACVEMEPLALEDIVEETVEEETS